LLRDHHAHREAGVDDLGRDLLCSHEAALDERAEPGFARVGEALLDRRERTPVEQVGRMHGVPGLTQLVGECPHAVGQALDVVVQHDLAHPRSS
jgi:hypothetical protein